MKRILITNDDGYSAEGLCEIVRELKNDYNITVVAPNEQKSGAGMSITFRHEIKVERVSLSGMPDIPAYAVAGTPADCVKAAIGYLKLSPDLVISGINLGANLGTDVWYSGTIGAATEAALLGFPALALSVVSHDAAYVKDAAKACRDAVDFYAENTDICDLLSVNVPNLPLSEMKGMRVAHLSRRNYPLDFIENGEGSLVMPPWQMIPDEHDADCDEYLVREGFITWTPVRVDRCEYEKMHKLKNAFSRWKNEN